MRLFIKLGILLFISALICGEGYTQVTITGPVCVKKGTQYQYLISANWKENVTSRVCITGGTLAETGGSCTAGVTIGALLVIWDSASTKGAISFSSSLGNTTYDVTIIPELDPGSVSSVKAQLVAYNAKMPGVTCTPATGGNCSPSYAYQWQSSDDAVNWTDIPSASLQHLSATFLLKTPTFYRRRVTEKTSGIIAYSDIVTIFVDPLAVK